MDHFQFPPDVEKQQVLKILKFSQNFKQSEKSNNTASKILQKRTIGTWSTCFSLLTIRSVNCGKRKKFCC